MRWTTAGEGAARRSYSTLEALVMRILSKLQERIKKSKDQKINVRYPVLTLG